MNVPPQRCPQKGMFRSTFWMVSCCTGSSTAESLCKWQENVKALVSVVLSVLESFPSLELALAHALGIVFFVLPSPLVGLLAIAASFGLPAGLGMLSSQ